MRIDLTYFKSTGYWYGCGHYETQCTAAPDIVEEVRRKLAFADLPGLKKGERYTVLITGTEKPFVLFHNI